MVLKTPFGRAETPRVSIIIPVFAPDLLPACLAALQRNVSLTIPFEVIVVLNQNTPALEQCLADWPEVQVVRTAVNLGLAGAGNRGRSLARGEFLVILHDDAEIEKGWLEALVDTADEYPEAGAIGGKVLFPDGTLQDAGKILWRDASTFSPWIGEAPAPGAFDRLRAVDYCGTSSLLVRAELWNAIGGMDEQFYPVYYVDVDLAMGVRHFGRIVLYQPKSCIRHHRGASTGTRDYRDFITRRNRRRFVRKWGAALESHEVREETMNGLERAMARAEAFAEECRQNPVPVPVRGKPALDPAVQDETHRQKERELQAAYAEYLESGVES